MTSIRVGTSQIQRPRRRSTRSWTIQNRSCRYVAQNASIGVVNRHQLPMVQQLANKRHAEKQAQFCVEQIKINSNEEVVFCWNIHGAVICGSLLHCRSCFDPSNSTSACAYELKDPDSGLPVRKPTGLAVSGPGRHLSRPLRASPDCRSLFRR